MRPAPSSTRKCREIAGNETSKGAASAPTEVSPRARRARIVRRVGSESAEKTASRRAAAVFWLTTWLNVERTPG